MFFVMIQLLSVVSGTRQHKADYTLSLPLKISPGLTFLCICTFLAQMIHIFKKTTEIIFLIFNFLSAQNFLFYLLQFLHCFSNGRVL